MKRTVESSPNRVRKPSPHPPFPLDTSEHRGQVARIQRALSRWYTRARRELPWRGTADPYRVWVSEVMLQQTRVETVRPYFERWMRAFPTISSLAQADEQDVLSAWQGLGYYSRARALRRAALVVMDRHGGALPSQPSELRSLPGIGPYSAGAISSIAFGVRTPLVDGNVERVLCRLFALRGDPARQPLARFLWELAASLVPATRPGDFNQAMMELGATRCTPRSPVCEGCPVAPSCAARAAGIASELPESAKRQKPVEEKRVAAVIRRGDKVALTTGAADQTRWKGLWQFPNLVVDANADPGRALARHVARGLGITVNVGDVLHTQRHSITRYRVTLDAYECRPIGGRLRTENEGAKWVSLDDIETVPMPAPHRRIARAL